MRTLWLLFLSTLALASSPTRDLIASGRLDHLRWPDFSDFRADLDSFYQPDYAPAWSRKGSITPQALAAIELLKAAESKGLLPEDYDASRWTARLANPDPTRFDLALTICLMRYVSDLHTGRWNPRIYNTQDASRDALAPLIRRLVNEPNPGAILSTIEPPFPVYQRTQAALQRYLALAREDNGALLPSTKRSVEPGDPYPGIPRLAALLQKLGDLPAATPVPGTYSGPLIDAVKHFQLRHGLDPDGRLGKSTLAQLNVPLARRVHQLQLTLERFRWIPYRFARSPLIVNIPAFELRALDDSYRTVLEMKVVVGQAYRKETPVFAAEMKYVTFRPYWHVPRSILMEELLPKIERNPAYLAANGYEVVTPADRVAPTGDDTLARLRAGKLAVRQVPGAKNSLGSVAFMFPNQYDVYLHDTPAQVLFSKSRREFSHGCIRVEKPFLLAQWVLRESPEWTPGRIADAMQTAKALKVDLKTPIPVLLVYATAIAQENGDVRFFDDIYGFDAQLDELQAKGYPRSRWRPTTGARARRPRG